MVRSVRQMMIPVEGAHNEDSMCALSCSVPVNGSLHCMSALCFFSSSAIIIIIIIIMVGTLGIFFYSKAMLKPLLSGHCHCCYPCALLHALASVCCCFCFCFCTLPVASVFIQPDSRQSTSAILSVCVFGFGLVDAVPGTVPLIVTFFVIILAQESPQNRSLCKQKRCIFSLTSAASAARASLCLHDRRLSAAAAPECAGDLRAANCGGSVIATTFFFCFCFFSTC